MGIISGMMAGAGEGLVQTSKMAGEYVVRSKLQEEGAEIQRLRDERMAELQEQAAVRADERRRAPAKAAAEEIDKKKGETVDADFMGTQRPRTKDEIADVEESAYRRQGLVQEAMSVRTTEQQRVRDQQSAVRDNARDSETVRHHTAVELLQAGQLKEAKETGALDRAIKQLAVDNGRRAETLRAEFVRPETTLERKRVIHEELQILTGKDSDKFLPVPLKDELGNITGYKVLNTRTGEWMDEKPAAGAASTGAKWDNASGKVMLDGREIGTARTREEAAALVAKARGAAPKKKPEPAGSAIVKSAPRPGLAQVLDAQQPPRKSKPLPDIDEDDRMPVP